VAAVHLAAIHVATVIAAGIGWRQQRRGGVVAVYSGGRSAGMSRGRLRAWSVPGKSTFACAQLARVAAHTVFVADHT